MTGRTIPGGAVADTGSAAESQGAGPIPGAPDASFVVPEPLTRRFGDDIEEIVWINEVGGVTVRAALDGRPVYAKWAPAGSELDLPAEAERLRWAAEFVEVPQVIDVAAGDEGEVLVTHALAGESAVAARWRADPERTVRALGSGLRTLHERLPVADCPYSWLVEARIARSRAEGVPERATALDLLPATPPIDRLVVCHGDACAPNTLLADDGSVCGHVDLGRLGIADRWADIAVGAWSTEWNYGPGYTNLYYASYGVEPDEEHIAFYRALWDAT